MKWDGEWHITFEVFRDLGISFAVVLVIIYLLIVGMFQNFNFHRPGSASVLVGKDFQRVPSRRLIDLRK